ncbi:MAG: alpha/beta fold hydrolase [Deltaproteobacteria bacterium]|nr:alpha/beta fold hydrolase [Deltaproteobacteria bacterium]
MHRTSFVLKTLPFLIAVAIICGCLATVPAGVTPRVHERECVILVHGMMRSAVSMNGLDAFLRKRGYQTVNLDYPTTRDSIERIAEMYIAPAVSQCLEQRYEKIHFVTHSMGGLVVRRYLEGHAAEIPPGSRVVMLAPPNRGTEVADFFKDSSLYQSITGPAGQELGTSPENLPVDVKPVNLEVGVIAGNFSLNPFFSLIIPGDDDGTVSVERTKLEGMTDFLVVPRSHFFIMRDEAVMAQAVFFLENGKFAHPD